VGKDPIIENENLTRVQLLFKHRFRVHLLAEANIDWEIEVAFGAFADSVKDVEYGKFLSVMVGECYYVCKSPE
jgi:hypothetical protein